MQVHLLTYRAQKHSAAFCLAKSSCCHNRRVILCRVATMLPEIDGDETVGEPEMQGRHLDDQTTLYSTKLHNTAAHTWSFSILSHLYGGRHVSKPFTLRLSTKASQLTRVERVLSEILAEYFIATHLSCKLMLEYSNGTASKQCDECH